MGSTARFTAAVALVVVMAACGSSDKSDDSGSGTTTTVATTASTAAGTGSAAAVISVSDAGGKGPLLVDSRGRTVYVLETEKGTVSACMAGCAKAWPAVVAMGTPTGGKGVVAAKLATADGQVAHQVVYNGHLLYTFTGDTKAGDVNGAAVPNWYPLKPDGSQLEGDGADETTTTSGY